MSQEKVNHFSPNANPTSDIERGKPYSIRDFVQAMNDRHITKFTGSQFKYIDIVGYLNRGYLPKAYGGYKLQKIKAGSEIHVVMTDERIDHYGSKPIHNVE